MAAHNREATIQHLINHYGSECIGIDFNKEKLVCYDGFEPSGRMHIAQGLMKAHFVNHLTQNGCEYIFWVADWFAKLNLKLKGDLDKIQTVGKYMIEIWKACGMDMSKVTFLWTSEEFQKRGDEYWSRVMDISTRNSVQRITRCTQIMGRNDKNLSASQIMYPCMQAADVFFLQVDVCQMGMDQRKVNMLAREYADDVGLPKPGILSHPMVPGLKKGQEKMSKSQPNTAIFMDDSIEEVASKIKGAYCPPHTEFVVGDIASENLANPVLAYFRLIVADAYPEMQVDDRVYTFPELRAAYIAGEIHPVDLKLALTKYINEMLQPVRDYFSNNAEAAALRDMVRSY